MVGSCRRCTVLPLEKQRDAFGLTLLTNNRCIIRRPSPAAHQQLIFSQLEPYIYDQTFNKKTSAADSLHRIADMIHKRSLVIIFSDMLEDPARMEPMFDSLQHLKHNKHEVILFHVVDASRELLFEFDNRPMSSSTWKVAKNYACSPTRSKGNMPTR